MNRYLFFLAAFLGALGIGLFWFDGFVKDRVDDSRAAGFAECEAEFAMKEVVIAKKEKEVENVQNRKKAAVWSRPSSRLGQLIKRMREQGIGTTDNYSTHRNLPVGGS